MSGGNGKNPLGPLVADQVGAYRGWRDQVSDRLNSLDARVGRVEETQQELAVAVASIKAQVGLWAALGAAAASIAAQWLLSR